MKLILILVFAVFSLNSYAQNSQFIPTSDGVLHYKTFGKGKPIVIINGGPGMNSEGFGQMAEQLSNEGFLCIIYDQRGTGKSEIKMQNTATITMKKMVEDLEVLRKHLKIKKWIVFGQSFGGLLSAQYAHTYPKSIEKLVFSNSGGLNLDFLTYVTNRIDNNMTQSEKDSMEYFQNLLNKSPEDKNVQLGRARQLASAYTFDKGHIPALANRMLQVNININQLVYSDLQKNKFDYVGKFTGNNTPVLIFQGLNDIIAIETAQTIEKSFKNSKLVKLEKCGHYPWLDRPDIFWNEILSFLKK